MRSVTNGRFQARGLTLQEIQELLRENARHRCDGMGPERACLRLVSMAELPSIFGYFQIAAFQSLRDGKEHVALIHGRVLEEEAVPVRIHSECLTGDVLGSLRCDCREQLTGGLQTLVEMGRGVLLYLRQEGRGIGLANKIRAYALQEQGLDTREANLALGFREDERQYGVAAHMLRSLRVRSIQLITNNPHKILEIEACGIPVVKRIPLVIPPNPHNRCYLETKARKFGHLLEGLSLEGPSPGDIPPSGEEEPSSLVTPRS